MAVVIITMLVILVLAVGIIAVVVMGIEGTGKAQHPDIAEAMARTAQHLSGDADPPQGLRDFARELDEAGVQSLKEIPAKVRSLRSATSAASAASASAPEPEQESNPSSGASPYDR